MQLGARLLGVRLGSTRLVIEPELELKFYTDLVNKSNSTFKAQLGLEKVQLVCVGLGLFAEARIVNKLGSVRLHSYIKFTSDSSPELLGLLNMMIRISHSLFRYGFLVLVPLV